MFFILSKILSWVIMPVSLIGFSLIAAVFIHNEKLKRAFFWIGITLFFVFTNPLISKIAINSWEPEVKKYIEINEKYEWAIVLAGITSPNRPPFDRIHFNKGADRLVHAIDLYKKGFVRKILISGGSGVLSFEGKPESIQLRSFAISMGVRSRDIIVDDKSRNTWENAHNSRKILVDKKARGKVLLITSAFHMPRAKACFDKLGFHTDTFPTDYYGGPFRFTIDEIILPKLYGLQIWSILIKEWAGLTAYKIAGYI
ncbi:MAG: YdcF family protein [Reichenbachiella sp.]